MRWGIHAVIKDGNNAIPKQFLSAVRLIMVGNALPARRARSWSAVDRSDEHLPTSSLGWTLEYATAARGFRM